MVCDLVIAKLNNCSHPILMLYVRRHTSSVSEYLEDGQDKTAEVTDDSKKESIMEHDGTTKPQEKDSTAADGLSFDCDI